MTAIKLATGKVLWTHNYSSPNGGPDGVTAATDHAAAALWAATGKQLWSRTLTGNNHEGIDIAPGYHDGTVYVSTVPVNPAAGEYLGGGNGILWALNAGTGAPEWSWDEVQNLWGMRRSTPAMACGIRRRSMPRATSTSASPTPGSDIPASSTSHTPSANWPVTRPATSAASRVMPTPPGPVTLTSRYSRSSAAASSSWLARPTKLVRARAKPCGPASAVPSPPCGVPKLRRVH